MEHHGSQEREIAYVLNILYLERRPICVVVQIMYVLSVYPQKAAKRPSRDPAASVSGLARFERVQRCSAATNEMECVAREKEEESNIRRTQQAIRAFKHNHGSYCKMGKEQPCEPEVEQVVVCYPGGIEQSSEREQLPSIPAEVGKVITVTLNACNI